MNELASILRAWRAGPGELPSADAVLATVVHVQGSAYRRPGARMLILADGTRIGTISGGCLEQDVARKASWWTSRTDHALRTFDTSSEEAAWEFGLGCNGVITVLLERLQTPAIEEQLAFLDAALGRREEVVVVTVTRVPSSNVAPAAFPDRQPGDRLLWSAAGPQGGALAQGLQAADFARLAAQTLADRRHRWATIGRAEVFAEFVAPPPRLVIFGAGHDVIPVVALGRQLGWHLTVADPRANYVHPERFPGADRVVLLPSDQAIDLGIDAETAVVLMTHNYPLDVAWLPRILAARPRYLGLLGPRRRAERLFAETGLDPRTPGVHAPVGLDLGGDHPETIALSVLSEIQAVLSGRAGGSLCHRLGPIHEPLTENSRTTDVRNARRPVPLEDETLATPACRWTPQPAYA